MKRGGLILGRAAMAASALSLFLAVSACEEDGKTVPERCAVLPEPFDIQNTPPPEDDNRSLNPGSGGDGGLPKCVTEVGHAVSSFVDPSMAGTSGSGGSASGGTGTGGSSPGGDAGTAGADAGAGTGGA
jgi:hypothetical protein